MVEMSKDARKAYSIFSWLRQNFPNADVCTLRHVSVYIARTNDEFDIDRDLQVSSATDDDKLYLTNGSKIVFPKVSDSLKFLVVNEDSDFCYMTLCVSKKDKSDLSLAYIMGTVVCDQWLYKVGMDDYESNRCFIKVYYEGKLFEDGTSYFKLSVDDDISLDCIDGLGYLTDIMIRVKLLYDNLRSMKKNKLVRKK